MVRTGYPAAVKVISRGGMHFCLSMIFLGLAYNLLTYIPKGRRGRFPRSMINEPIYMTHVRQFQARDYEVQQRVLRWKPGDSLKSPRLSKLFNAIAKTLSL
eukprot:TRINITY_DN7534_c0_g3_i1.p1 TRINITY_DN7534_c0_g3~~TRINITY_DN7534_c0_g3_i1.p1  ORF type:complete len:101 (+),score=17.79 TRINITY_DN7534_c0_g3_i1:179-481(+)